MTTTTIIKGLPELDRLFKQLPAQLARDVMPGALKAAAEVIAAEARARAPVAPPNSENRRLYHGRAGLLRDSIRVVMKSVNGRVTASVQAGSDDAYYAHMVEYGTAAHVIAASRQRPRSALLFLGDIFRGKVNHPGTAQRAFMRPAIDSKKDAAVAAAAAYIVTHLPALIGKGSVSSAPALEETT